MKRNTMKATGGVNEHPQLYIANAVSIMIGKLAAENKREMSGNMPL
jgi:hypothetical protein